MTVESEVANLTSAVNTLTAAVNVKKVTLDNAVADAEAAEGVATTKAIEAAASAAEALASKIAAETAEGNATGIVYGGGYSTTPIASNVPIADVNGTLENWVNPTIKKFTNPLARAVRIAMTGATSGSSGIRAPTSTIYDLGISNFTLHWEGSLPDYTPSSIVRLLYKYQSANERWAISVNTNGTIGLIAVKSGAALFNVSSTVAAGVSDGSPAKITASVVRETATTAGSVTFYVNGVQLGTAVTIPAAATASISNTGPLYSLGDDAARFESTLTDYSVWNRALSASEVLSLTINGPALADIGASQVPLYTSDFSAGTDAFTGSGGTATGNVDGIAGQDDWLSFWANSANSTHYLQRVVNIQPTYYLIEFDCYIPSSNTNVNRVNLMCEVEGNAFTAPNITSVTTLDTIVSVRVIYLKPAGSTLFFFGAAVNNSKAFVGANSPTDDLFYIKNIKFTRLGTTAWYNAADAQSNTGQIIDRSGNKGHALLPASGARVLGANPARSRQVRSPNHSWSSTNELQYWTGVNQEILPPSAAMEYIDIFSSGSVSVNIGNGTTANHYASAVALSAGWNRVTLSNAFAGTTTATRKLTVTPTASFNGSLQLTATYHATEVES